MAETVHLYLKIKGVTIQGESTQVTLGRENSIECLYWKMAVSTAREAGSGLATGRRQYEPLIIRKRIDKSTPLLAKALCNNEVIEGVFKFFRPNPLADGSTEQFYTIKLAQGRVSALQQSSDAGLASTAPMEEVSFVFHNITWTYTNGGIEHQDTWNAIT